MEEVATITVIEQAELISAIDTVWVSICAAIIFLMEGGFALLEAGFVRSKNSMSIIAKVIIDIIFGGLAFYAIGFGIAYGASNGYFAFDTGITDTDIGLGLTISNKLFWFIQLGYFNSFRSCSRANEGLGICIICSYILCCDVSISRKLGLEP